MAGLNPEDFRRYCENDFVNCIFIFAMSQGLLEKNPERRLTWKRIIDHEFIRDQINIDNTRGEFSLAKELSPSQELLREKQRQNYQKKVQVYSK